MTFASVVRAGLLRLAFELNRHAALSGVPLTDSDLGVSPGPRVANGESLAGAVQQLTPQVDEDWGTAFPTPVWPGRNFFRTDEGIQYYFNGDTSTWTPYGAQPAPPISGTSFPANPIAGQTFMRTDLDDEVFTWFPGRAKWMGPMRWIGLAENSDNDLIGFEGMIVSTLSKDGTQSPWDACITRVYFQTRDPESMIFNLRKDNVVFLPITVTSQKFTDTGPITLDWLQGEVLSARVSALTTGTTFQRLHGRIEYRQVAT